MEVDYPAEVQSVADLPGTTHTLILIFINADFVGHDDRAWHVAWNPTSPILASCSADKTVRLYSYLTQSVTQGEDSAPVKFIHNNTIPTGHTKTVRALAWSPSGKTLATASFDANIGIWEQEESDGDGEKGEWECMSLLEGHETECKSVAYSSTGTLLASCSRDKTVWIWEGEYLCLLSYSLKDVYSVIVHPDADFECMGVLMEHSQDVKCVAWHPKEEVSSKLQYHIAPTSTPGSI